MRRRLRRTGGEADVNMTPMLDIVFILLIFFIVTAVFLREKGLDLRQPPADKDIPQTTKPVIRVAIDSENFVFVDDRQTAVERVTASVERIRADKPGAAVVLIPEEESHHGITVRIVDELRSLGITVSIQRKKGEGS